VTSCFFFHHNFNKSTYPHHHTITLSHHHIITPSPTQSLSLDSSEINSMPLLSQTYAVIWQQIADYMTDQEFLHWICVHSSIYRCFQSQPYLLKNPVKVYTLPQSSCIYITKIDWECLQPPHQLNVKFELCWTNLPPSLISLDLPRNYNSPIPECHVPRKLKHLSFGYEFNHPLPRLPTGLRSLRLSTKFNHPIDDLPPSLHILSMQSSSYSHAIIQWPPKLSILSIFISPGMSIKHWPSVDVLAIEMDWRTNIDIPPPFPTSLRILELGNFKSIAPIDLPDNLQEFMLLGNANPVIAHWPRNLKYFTTEFDFNQPLHHLNVSDLQELELGERFNHPFTQVFPKLWRFALFNHSYNYPINFDLFPQVEDLTLSCNELNFVEWSRLPSSVRSLTLIAGRRAYQLNWRNFTWPLKLSRFQGADISVVVFH